MPEKTKKTDFADNKSPVLKQLFNNKRLLKLQITEIILSLLIIILIIFLINSTF